MFGSRAGGFVSELEAGVSTERSRGELEVGPEQLEEEPPSAEGAAERVRDVLRPSPSGAQVGTLSSGQVHECEVGRELWAEMDTWASLYADGVQGT